MRLDRDKPCAKFAQESATISAERTNEMMNKPTLGLPLHREAGYNDSMSPATSRSAWRATAPPVTSPVRRYSRILLALPFLPLLLLALAPAVYDHLRAASILMVIADMPDSAMQNFDANPVREEDDHLSRPVHGAGADLSSHRNCTSQRPGGSSRRALPGNG